ncbi:uncharacterized protein [Rutidosis leptorrhynchoides]|uniref:uncharacterized protein n=1 Tax=Rutidosis leptorrhynchoides TaxID=125765 RepID=UPI003A99C6BB
MRSDSPHSSSLGTWTNIILAGKEIDEMNIPFSNSFVKTLGDGSSTAFWKEVWIGSSKLCDKYPRLYMLECVQNAMVSDRLQICNATMTYNWNWIRTPCGRTMGKLDSLTELLSGTSLSSETKDKWLWIMSGNERFTVKILSSIIDESLLAIGTNNYETIRNNLVPKKLEIFTWRVIKKRILVKLELDKRGIDLHSVRCPLCDDDLETIDHALIFCKHSLDVWNRIFKWWGLGNFSNLSTNEILRGIAPSQMSNLGRLIWQAVEWVCVYFIWKNRNNRVFHGKMWNTPIALNEIQSKSFEWISHRSKGKKLDWFDWLNNPSVYLTI